MSTSARVITSSVVRGMKSAFFLLLQRDVLLPLTKRIWRGKVGTHDFNASIEIAPVMSIPITSAPITSISVPSSGLADMQMLSGSFSV